MKRWDALIFAITLLMCACEIPNQDKNTKPHLFDPDGYYVPTENDISCPVEHIHISTHEYIYDGHLHHDPKLKTPEVAVRLKRGDKIGNFTFECKKAFVSPDNLHLECGAESETKLTVDGAFHDKRGQYWNQSDIKSRETVVLSAQIKQSWQGRTLYSGNVRFTYWDGDIALPANSVAASGDQFMNLFGFELNETKLADIQKSLGHVDVVEAGDAAEYTASLCYVLLQHNITIDFLSGGIGGRDILDGLRVREGRDSAKTCHELRNKTIQPSDLGGLKIGMTLQEFEKLMSNSKKISRPPEVEYRFNYKKLKPEHILKEERKYSFDTALQWDVLIQVIGTFTSNRLVELRIFRSLSN